MNLNRCCYITWLPYATFFTLLFWFIPVLRDEACMRNEVICMRVFIISGKTITFQGKNTKNIYLKLFPWISVICCILFPHVFCCILMVFQCALKYSTCYLRFKTHPPVTCFMVEILYLGCFWILYIKIWLTQSINSCSTFASR